MSDKYLQDYQLQQAAFETLEPRLLYSAEAALPGTEWLISEKSTPSAEVLVSAPSVVSSDIEVSFDLDASIEKTLVVIDEALINSEAFSVLNSAFNTGTVEWLIVNSESSGLEQISERLDALDLVSSIHIFSHGSDGELLLGGASISAATLEASSSLLSAWGQSLSVDADILLYGCDIAQSSAGQSLVNSLANLTGADVAASNDKSGEQGDWSLEYQVGNIEASLHDAALADWSVTLTATITQIPDAVALSNPAETESVDGRSTQAIAMNSAGHYVVVWSYDDGHAHGYEVFAQLFDAAGGTIRDAFLVTGSELSGDQRFASVGMADDGSFVVVWGSDESGDSDIYARQFTANGTANGAATLVNSTSVGEQENASIAVDDNGQVIIAWQGPDNADQSIYTRRFSMGASGLESIDTTETLVTIAGDGSYAKSSPVVEWLNDGRSVAGWLQHEDTVSHAYIRIFDADGNAEAAYATGPKAVDFHGFLFIPSNDSSDLTIEANSSGEFVVSFKNSSSSSPGVYLRLFDFLGEQVAPGNSISHNINQTLSDGSSPSVFLADDGKIVVVYQSAATSGDIRYKVFDNSGSSFNELAAGVLVAGSGLETPTIAAINANNFVVTWSDGTNVSINEFSYIDVSSSVLDQFNEANYSGSDGGIFWAGDWVEVDTSSDEDDDDNGSILATTGEVYVDAEDGYLSLGGKISSIERAVDLTGAGSAVLYFDFFSDTMEGGDDVYVLISTDNGSSWVELHYFPAFKETNWYSFSMDISDYVQTNAIIKFASDFSKQNGTDYFRIDNISVSIDTLNSEPVAVLDPSYEVSVGNAITLSAAGSSDADGDSLTYGWDIDNDGDYSDYTGEILKLSWGDLASAGINALGDYTISLRVGDGEGGVDSTQSVLTVEPSSPVIVAAQSANSIINFSENSTETIVTVEVQDSSGLQPNFSLSGADSALFEIGASGELTFINPPNYEAPTDNDTDNTYSFYVNATNPEYSTSDSQLYSIVVDNADDLTTGAIKVLDSEDDEFNKAIVGGTYHVDLSGLNDEDGLLDESFVYEWSVAEEVGGLKTVVGNLETYTVQLDDAAKLLFLTMQVTDDVDSDPVSISSVSHFPIVTIPKITNVDSVFNVDENISTTIGVVSAVDSYSNDLVFSLSGADAGLFTINNDGELGFISPADYESPLSYNQDNQYEIVVVVSNSEFVTNATRDFQINVLNVNEPYTGSLTINSSDSEGRFIEGSILTVDASDISDQDVSGALVFEYQWYRDGTVISGAESSSYLLVDDDVAKSISVKVSYIDDQSTPQETMLEKTMGVILGINDDPSGGVVIATLASEDDSLTADISSLVDPDNGLNFTPSYEYSWLRNGALIIGEITENYTVTQTDVGQRISVQISYVDGQGFTEKVLSNLTDTVVNVQDPTTGYVEIIGVAGVGETLLTSLDNLNDEDGIDTSTITYQWYRDGQLLLNATEIEYQVTLGDQDSVLLVEVSYSDLANPSINYTGIRSAVSLPVVSANQGVIGRPVIVGDVIEDSILSVDLSQISDGNLVNGLPNELDITWLRGAVEVAAGEHYILTDDDVNSTLSVIVKYQDDLGYQEETRSIDSVAVVNVNDAPVITAVNLLSGVHAQGETLTLNVAAISDDDGISGNFTVQWFRTDSELSIGQVISGVTSNTYTATQLDVGLKIYATVSYIDSHGGEELIRSEFTAFISNVDDKPQGSLTILGDVSRNQTLSLSNNLTDLDGIDHINYSWFYSSGEPISESADSYLLTAADVGKQLYAVAEIVDNDGNSDTVESDTTVVVNNEQPEIIVNQTTIVAEGARVVIDSARLSAVDLDGDDLYFRLLELPRSGELQIDGESITEFTQEQLNDGLVSYLHDGSEVTEDYLTLSVSDGLISDDSVVFVLKVNQVNDAPILVNAGSVTGYASQSPQLLDYSILNVSDVDDDSDQLRFVIESIPDGLELQLNGVVLEVGQSFTQEEIYSENVSYKNTDNLAVSGNLLMTLFDSSQSSLDVAIDFNLRVLQEPIVDVQVTPGEASFDLRVTAVSEDAESVSHFKIEAIKQGKVSLIVDGNEIAVYAGDVVELQNGEVLFRYVPDDSGDIDSGQYAIQLTAVAGVSNTAALTTNQTFSGVPKTYRSVSETEASVDDSGDITLSISSDSVDDIESVEADSDVLSSSRIRVTTAGDSDNKYLMNDSRVVAAIRIAKNVASDQAENSDNSELTLSRLIGSAVIEKSNLATFQYLINSLDQREHLEFQTIVANSFDNLFDTLKDIHKEREQEILQGKMVVGGALMTSAGLSVGYVLWLVRGGILMSTVMFSMPAWMVTDPLVLFDEEAHKDERSLADLAKGEKAGSGSPVEKQQS